jgi:hypothetical protein
MSLWAILHGLHVSEKGYARRQSPKYNAVGIAVDTMGDACAAGRGSASLRK